MVSKSNATYTDDLGRFNQSVETIKAINAINEISDLKYKEINMWNLVNSVWAAYYLPEAIHRRELKSLKLEITHFVNRFIKTIIKQLFWYLKTKYYQKKHQKNISINLNSQRLFYLVFEPRQYEDISSILELARTNDKLHIYLIGSKTRHNYFLSSLPTNCTFLVIEDFFYAIKRPKLKTLYSQLKKVKSKLVSLSLSLSDTLLWPLIKYDWFQFYHFTVKELSFEIDTAQYLLNLIKPNLVITADDCNPKQRVYLELSRQQNIKSLIIQQGFTSQKSVEWYFSLSDQVACMSQDSQNQLQKMNVLSEKISITGQPRFDSLTQTPQQNHSLQVLKKMKVNSDQPLILFASQPYCAANFKKPEDRKKMIDSICQAFQALPQLQLVIKPHPDESIEDHLISQKKYNVNQNLFVLKDPIDIRQLIHASQAVIIYQSTTGLETALAQKPLIVFDPTGRYDTTFYVSAKIATGVQNKEELKSILVDLSNHNFQPTRNSNLDFFVYNTDGQASQRVYDLINKLIIL